MQGNSCVGIFSGQVCVCVCVCNPVNTLAASTRSWTAICQKLYSQNGYSTEVTITPARKEFIVKNKWSTATYI